MRGWGSLHSRYPGGAPRLGFTLRFGLVAWNTKGLEIAKGIVSGAAGVVDVVYFGGWAAALLACVAIAGKNLLADMSFHVGRGAVSPCCHMDSLPEGQKVGGVERQSPAPRAIRGEEPSKRPGATRALNPPLVFPQAASSRRLYHLL